MAVVMDKEPPLAVVHLMRPQGALQRVVELLRPGAVPSKVAVVPRVVRLIVEEATLVIWLLLTPTPVVEEALDQVLTEGEAPPIVGVPEPRIVAVTALTRIVLTQKVRPIPTDHAAAEVPQLEAAWSAEVPQLEAAEVPQLKAAEVRQLVAVWAAEVPQLVVAWAAEVPQLWAAEVPQLEAVWAAEVEMSLRNTPAFEVAELPIEVVVPTWVVAAIEVVVRVVIGEGVLQLVEEAPGVVKDGATAMEAVAAVDMVEDMGLTMIIVVTVKRAMKKLTKKVNG